MALKIRLKRMGAKRQPRYRFVVADARSPRDGRFVEELGHYNPTAKPAIVHFDEERTLAWLQKGAQPSETVKSLLKQQGLWQRFRATRQA